MIYKSLSTPLNTDSIGCKEWISLQCNKYNTPGIPDQLRQIIQLRPGLYYPFQYHGHVSFFNNIGNGKTHLRLGVLISLYKIQDSIGSIC